MRMPQQWEGHAIESRQIASTLGDSVCARGLCEPGSTITMPRSLVHTEAHMSKTLPRLPDTRIVHIPTKELAGWARELDIDTTGLDEATLRLRLKQECDRLFPIVYADFIKAYNEMLEEDGFPLAEWSYI